VVCGASGLGRCDGHHKLLFESPIIFWTPRVIDVQSPKRRPPTTALSKKLHSLPSSVRRIIQPRGWRVLVATAAEECLNIRAQYVHFFCGILGNTEGVIDD
jgi:hypothetical protein